MSDVATSTAPVVAANAPVASLAPQGAASPTPTPPTAPGGASAPSEADARMSAKFAALTRKEQAAVQALQAAKAERAAADAARAEATAEKAKWEAFRGRPERGLDALKELGLTYEQLTKLYLNDGVMPADMHTQQLQQEIEGIKAQRLKDQEDARSAQLANGKQAEEQAIASFKAGISQHVEAEKASYPIMTYLGQTDQVYALIDGHYAKTGQVLQVPDAAKMVEDYLREQVSKAKELLPTPPAPPPSEPAQKRDPFKPLARPASSLGPSAVPVTSSTSTKPKVYRSRIEEIDAIVARHNARK